MSRKNTVSLPARNPAGPFNPLKRTPALVALTTATIGAFQAQADGLAPVTWQPFYNSARRLLCVQCKGFDIDGEPVEVTLYAADVAKAKAVA